MAPQRQKQMKQLSLLHFTKRNAVAPQQTLQQLPRPTKTPIRPMPRPTAPPFFRTPLPKQSVARNLSAVLDDAWEVADRFMNEQHAPASKKPAFEDDAPLMEDSDDDFELHVVTQRTPKPRASCLAKSSTPLRDDRASMTKTLTKLRPSELDADISIQQRSVFEDYGLPPKVASLSSSDDEQDDNHITVFDGEKSSLSGTSDEDELNIDSINLDTDLVESLPSEKQTRNKSRSPNEIRYDYGGNEIRDNCDVYDLNIDHIVANAPLPDKHITSTPTSQENRRSSKSATPSRASRPRQIDIKLAVQERSTQPSKEKQSFPVEVNLPNHSFRGFESKTIGGRKRSTGCDEVFQTHIQEQGPRRRKKILPLFDSDTDESSSSSECIFRARRRGRLKAPIRPSPSPSPDESLKNRVSSRPSARGTINSATDDLEEESERSGSRMDSRYAESSDVEVVSKPNWSRKNAQKETQSFERRHRRTDESRKAKFEVGDIQEYILDSPIRTPKRKKDGSTGTDPLRNKISEYIKTASPSLSPPSTLKKRRRLQKLIVTESSEDDQHVELSGKGSTLGKLGNRHQNDADSTTPEALSSTAKGTEWYHERDIDEFSESSCDTKPTPRLSYVTPTIKRRRREKSSASPSTRQLSPVKRSISKSFDESPDQRGLVGKPGRCPSTSQLQRHALHVRDATNRDHAEPTQNVNEVIDIVDEDEEPESASYDCNRTPEVHCSLSSGESEKINSTEFDDDAPPPFNLVALCKDGESICEMKERLGEEFVMGKVTEAQDNGREIVGGEELGLTGTNNKSVFDQFSKTVVADHLGKEMASQSVTEKALRGEYKFHYRGRQQDSTSGKRGRSSRGRPWGRFAKFRRKRCSS